MSKLRDAGKSSKNDYKKLNGFQCDRRNTIQKRMVRVTKESVKSAAKNAVYNSPRYAKEYFLGLFPIIEWLPRYNLTWLLGDVLAGITVGMVVIPQALSYAKLAGVPLEFGLYTSFIGVLAYALFATSKVL